MADLQQMSRLLYRHDWDRVEHWAAAVHQLADLTDSDITQLPKLADGATATETSRWPTFDDLLRFIIRALGSPRSNP